jgi:hypothetical protein
VKHLGYSVREAVAWHRICRPGSVVGPQQQYLCSIEDKLKMEGAQYYAKQAAAAAKARGGGTSPVPVPARRGSKDRGQVQTQAQAQGQLPERKNSFSNKLAQLNI